ncbi:MAG: hypothetical protein GY771_04260, partial [bacterium]|nr:hypothetical protein [bacterium]
HNRTLYDELIAVPLIMYFPDYGNGVVNEPASVIDIPKTLFSYLDSDKADLFAGNDLLRYINGNERSRAIYADRTEKDYDARSVRYKEYLLVHYTLDIEDTDISREIFELYRYKADPYCEYDLLDEYPAEAEELKEEMERFNGYLSETAALFGEGDDVKLTEGQLETLENLGYF